MKILVVEDELTNRLVLEELLSTCGEVHSCVDGREAVEASTRALENGSAYELICMDILMPNMNGLEALKLIRQKEESHGRVRPRASKVIITTAAQDGDTISEAFRVLCDAYIVKPIDAEELMDVVGCLFSVDAIA